MKKTIQNGAFATQSEIEIRDVIRTCDYDAYDLELELLGIDEIVGDVRLRFVRSDGQQIVTAPVTVDGNVIKYTFPTNVTALPSPLYMYVQMSDENLYTPLRVLFSGVETSPNDAGLPETDEYPELLEIIEDANAAMGSINTAKNEAIAASETSVAAKDASIAAKDDSVVAKNASVVAQGLSESARDASVIAKNASVVAQGLSETAKNEAVIAKNAAEQAAIDAGEAAQSIPAAHNGFSGLQGGAALERYHMTQVQNEALHAHSNKTALDAVSGTNTGDQDVSGAISTHNTDATAHANLIGDINSALAALLGV